MKELLTWPEIAVLAVITLLVCFAIVRRSSYESRDHKRRRDELRRHVNDDK